MNDPVDAPPRARLDRLDALRGVAMLWMAGFHLSFDLNHFGFIRQNFYTAPVWTLQRACIVSLFLLCVGVGQAIATEQRQPWPRFWRRWAQVAGCALLVSLGSRLMFPTSFISFGVLHCIALLLIVLRLAAGWRSALWAIGLVALTLPWWVADPWFDSRWTDWIGLVTTKPITEDFVPLLPWLAAACAGMAGGQWLLRNRRGWLAGGLAPALQPLAALGRWSLSFYMLHQPVLIGAVWLARQLR